MVYQKQVSFDQAVRMAFEKYCCFTGRASRSEYWWFSLFSFIVCFAISCLSYAIGEWITVLTLALLLPSLGLSWRRLHDIGKGGGWYFIGCIPVVGTILLLVWYCTDSEMVPNRFGPVPHLTEV